MWSLPTTSVTRTVRKDNTIVYESNRYSVPIGTYGPGKEVGVQEQDSKLIITDIETKKTIAEHQLSSEKGKLIRNRNHLRDRDTSIDELFFKVSSALDYVPGITHFLNVIRKEKGRYVRDQYNLILKSQKAYSQDVILQAFDFCTANRLYSAVCLKDSLEHFASYPEVAATSEFGTAGSLPDYLLIPTTVRSIFEYARLGKGGDSK